MTKYTIQQLISDAIRQEFEINLKAEDVHIERPQDQSHGDWATNIALQYAKELKQNPREIAVKIANQLIDPQIEVEIAGPGFINFKIDKENYKKVLTDILTQTKDYGNGEKLKEKKIMVEFAHPNPFKAFHIGHLRNIILGESLVRLLESQGADVIRTNYQGDVGMHIAKNLWAFQKIAPKDYPESADERVSLLGKLYAQGATAFEESEQAKAEITEINKKIYTKEDPEINKLWELGKKWSLEKFHEIYNRVYSHFDREYMETETIESCMKHIKRAKEEGILKDSEGAVIFDGKKYGLDTRVFLNSQGLPTYEGKELGLAYKEFSDFGELDKCIHVVAVEQISFFKVTFQVEELLDPEIFKDKQYHLAYEFVGLKKGKMSSRKGDVVLGNDILNEAHARIKPIVKEKGKVENVDEISEKIGVGAVKYSFLKISPFKYLKFDMDESVNFEGDSGPYIQYGYARAKSILREANEFAPLENLKNVLNNDLEINLLKWLERFPEVVALASNEYTPNLIASYIYELTTKFNGFYKNLSVLNAENDEERRARLMLTEATTIVIKRGLDLLGIKTVEKM